VYYILRYAEYATAAMDALPESDHISTDRTLFNLMEHIGIWPAGFRTWSTAERRQPVNVDKSALKAARSTAS
jgi:hypothetical protein